MAKLCGVTGWREEDLWRLGATIEGFCAVLS
jgi:hypothetical protein